MSRAPRIPRAGGALCVFLLVACLTCGPVFGIMSPAGTAVAAPALLPTDEDRPMCAFAPDAFYVPQDIIGSRFRWYCRDGSFGSDFQVTDEDHGVNSRDNRHTLEWWAARNQSPDGSVNFGKLAQEPCDTWKDNLNIQRWQCLNIKEMSKQLEFGVCTRWKVLMEHLAAHDPNKFPPYNEARDGPVIAHCDTDNPVLAASYRTKPRVDKNEYSRTEFSAPGGLVSPLNQLLSIGVWLSLAASVAGVLMSAARLAIARQHGAEESVQGVFVVLAASLLGSTSSALAHFFLIP